MCVCGSGVERERLFKVYFIAVFEREREFSIFKIYEVIKYLRYICGVSFGICKLLNCSPNVWFLKYDIIVEFMRDITRNITKIKNKASVYKITM